MSSFNFDELKPLPSLRDRPPTRRSRRTLSPHESDHATAHEPPRAEQVASPSGSVPPALSPAVGMQPLQPSPSVSASQIVSKSPLIPPRDVTSVPEPIKTPVEQPSQLPQQPDRPQTVHQPTPDPVQPTESVLNVTDTVATSQPASTEDPLFDLSMYDPAHLYDNEDYGIQYLHEPSEPIPQPEQHQPQAHSSPCLPPQPQSTPDYDLALHNAQQHQFTEGDSVMNTADDPTYDNPLVLDQYMHNASYTPEHKTDLSSLEVQISEPALSHHSISRVSSQANRTPQHRPVSSVVSPPKHVPTLPQEPSSQLDRSNATQSTPSKEESSSPTVVLEHIVPAPSLPLYSTCAQSLFNRIISGTATDEHPPSTHLYISLAPPHSSSALALISTVSQHIQTSLLTLSNEYTTAYAQTGFSQVPLGLLYRLQLKSDQYLTYTALSSLVQDDIAPQAQSLAHKYFAAHLARTVKGIRGNVIWEDVSPQQPSSAGTKTPSIVATTQITLANPALSSSLLSTPTSAPDFHIAGRNILDLTLLRPSVISTTQHPYSESHSSITHGLSSPMISLDDLSVFNNQTSTIIDATRSSWVIGRDPIATQHQRCEALTECDQLILTSTPEHALFYAIDSGLWNTAANIATLSPLLAPLLRSRISNLFTPLVPLPLPFQISSRFAAFCAYKTLIQASLPALLSVKPLVTTGPLTSEVIAHLSTPFETISAALTQAIADQTRHTPPPPGPLSPYPEPSYHTLLYASSVDLIQSAGPQSLGSPGGSAQASAGHSIASFAAKLYLNLLGLVAPEALNIGQSSIDAMQSIGYQNAIKLISLWPLLASWAADLPRSFSLYKIPDSSSESPLVYPILSTLLHPSINWFTAQQQQHPSDSSSFDEPPSTVQSIFGGIMEAYAAGNIHFIPFDQLFTFDPQLYGLPDDMMNIPYDHTIPPYTLPLLYRALHHTHSQHMSNATSIERQNYLNTILSNSYHFISLTLISRWLLLNIAALLYFRTQSPFAALGLFITAGFGLPFIQYVKDQHALMQSIVHYTVYGDNTDNTLQQSSPLTICSPSGVVHVSLIDNLYDSLSYLQQYTTQRILTCLDVATFYGSITAVEHLPLISDTPTPLRLTLPCTTFMTSPQIALANTAVSLFPFDVTQHLTLSIPVSSLSSLVEHWSTYSTPCPPDQPAVADALYQQHQIDTMVQFLHTGLMDASITPYALTIRPESSSQYTISTSPSAQVVLTHIDQSFVTGQLLSLLHSTYLKQFNTPFTQQVASELGLTPLSDLTAEAQAVLSQATTATVVQPPVQHVDQTQNLQQSAPQHEQLPSQIPLQQPPPPQQQQLAQPTYEPQTQPLLSAQHSANTSYPASQPAPSQSVPQQSPLPQQNNQAQFSRSSSVPVSTASPQQYQQPPPPQQPPVQQSPVQQPPMQQALQQQPPIQQPPIQHPPIQQQPMQQPLPQQQLPIQPPPQFSPQQTYQPNNSSIPVPVSSPPATAPAPAPHLPPAQPAIALPPSRAPDQNFNSLSSYRTGQHKYPSNALLSGSSGFGNGPSSHDEMASAYDAPQQQQQPSQPASGVAGMFNVTTAIDAVNSVNVDQIKDTANNVGNYLKGAISNVGSGFFGMFGTQVSRREANLEQGSDWYYDETTGRYIDRMAPPEPEEEAPAPMVLPPTASAIASSQFSTQPPPQQPQFNQPQQQQYTSQQQNYMPPQNQPQPPTFTPIPQQPNYGYGQQPAYNQQYAAPRY